MSASFIPISTAAMAALVAVSTRFLLYESVRQRPHACMRPCICAGVPLYVCAFLLNLASLLQLCFDCPSRDALLYICCRRRCRRSLTVLEYDSETIVWVERLEFLELIIANTAPKKNRGERWSIWTARECPSSNFIRAEPATVVPPLPRLLLLRH